MKYAVALLAGLILVFSGCLQGFSNDPADAGTSRIQTAEAPEGGEEPKDRGGEDAGKECGTDPDCLYEALAEECSPATAQVSNEGVTLQVSVLGIKDGVCKVRSELTEFQIPGLEGLGYTCDVPLDRIGDYETFIREHLEEACSGSFLDIARAG